MKTILYVIAGSLLFSACSKDQLVQEDDHLVSVQAALSTASYNGDFVRIGVDSATVILTLNADGSFYGESLVPGFPVICEGSYTAGTSTIVFENVCSASGNQPILEGAFNYTKPSQQQLLIWRTISGVREEYRLRWRR